MAKEAPEDPYAGLADPDQLAHLNLTAAHVELADPTAEPAPDALSARNLHWRRNAAAMAVSGNDHSVLEAAGSNLFTARYPYCGVKRIFRWIYPHGSWALGARRSPIEAQGWNAITMATVGFFNPDLRVRHLSIGTAMPDNGPWPQYWVTRKPPTGTFARYCLMNVSPPPSSGIFWRRQMVQQLRGGDRGCGIS